MIVLIYQLLTTVFRSLVNGNILSTTVVLQFFVYDLYYCHKCKTTRCCWELFNVEVDAEHYFMLNALWESALNFTFKSLLSITVCRPSFVV